MTGDEGLFEDDPYVDPYADTSNSSTLQVMHAAGRRLLEPMVTDPAKAILRTRDYAPVIGYPDRGFQVTVRVTTASGKWANEYQSMQNGDILEYACGWLAGARLAQAVVLDAKRLAEDIEERQGCLVPASRTLMLHHAPGGAEFYVVDFRRCRPETILRTVGIDALVVRPAPLVTQEGLF